MKKYKIPKLEDFYQGMKYQIAHDQQMVIWDAQKEVDVLNTEWDRLWLDREVYWMGETKESHTEKYGENTVTIDSGTYDFFYRSPPYNIESMLEQELIRVEV